MEIKERNYLDNFLVFFTCFEDLVISVVPGELGVYLRACLTSMMELFCGNM